MKVLVYSDVHGNLPAFEKMLEKEKGYDTTICLGDLVNYGPWSNECVDLAMSLPRLALIMGNHEEAFLNGFYPGENSLVNSFFEQCYQHFSRRDNIAAFIPEYHLNDYSFRHTILNSYIYPDTTVKLDANYVIGHSHHQFLYNQGGHQLINAGSVGQNRAFINVANYLLLNTETGAFDLRHLVYDIDLVISKMRDLKYPDECIAYYTNKKRV